MKQTKFNIGARIAASFLPWMSKATPSRTALKVRVIRQWTPFSCTAAVLQMVADYHGFSISHVQAMKLLRCIPEGASLDEIAIILLDYGLVPKEIGKAGVRRALQCGQLVISNDAASYAHDHAILVIGATAKGFYIADPLVAEIYWRKDVQFFQGADEWIAISSPEGP